jgi:hypothetical protein
MNLSELETIAKEVSQSIQKITEKPLDIDSLILKMNNKSIYEDEAVKKALSIVSRPKLKYNTVDKLFYGPKNFIEKQLEHFAISFLSNNILMKYDNANVILVAPSFLDRKINSIKAMMAHELTHLQEDQLYQLQSLTLLENAVLVTEKIIEKRHELGILKGYILPNQEIKELKSEHKECLTKLNNYMTVLESHAEYVKERYMEDNKISIMDVYTKKEMVKSILTLPLLLVPGIGKKMIQYSKGKELIKNAYAWQVPIEKLYQNIPTDDDFKHVFFYLKKYTPEGKAPFCIWKDIC